jgi:cyclic beta-1,2-glucan glucanotransferase
MRSVPGTVLDQTVHAAVHCQIRFAHRYHLPWGISESAFGDRDAQGSYQYRAFGLPSMALDQQAREDLVIAPYASFLALTVEPPAGVHNLMRMEKMGWQGELGFYDSCDYRMRKKPHLVRNWMAHHQGMTLLALCNLLKQSAIQTWFHREPRVQATQLLLHEKTLPSARVETEMPRRAKKVPPHVKVSESSASISAPRPPTALRPTLERALVKDTPSPQSAEDSTVRDSRTH